MTDREQTIALADQTCESLHAAAPPTLATLFFSFVYLGATSFGGPAMIARIDAFVIGRWRWITRDDLQSGISLAQFVPGPIVPHLVAYIGYRLRGNPGAAAAFVGFALPAVTLMIAFSACYGTVHSLPLGAAVFNGLQAVIAAIVVHAGLSFGRQTLNTLIEPSVAILAAASFFAGVSPIATVGAGAILGGLTLPARASASHSHQRLRLRDFRVPLALAGASAVLGALLLRLDSLLFDLAFVMAKVDLFAFGGVYGSLPLMLHEVVELRHWLPASAFLDGLALGQITPGPIVITAAFVGWAVAGLFGALLATIAVFLPSFIILTAVMPVAGVLQRHSLAAPVRRGIFAAVVGLIAAAGIKLAMALPWTASSAALALGSLVASLMGAGSLWVVVAGGLTAAVIAML